MSSLARAERQGIQVIEATHRPRQRPISGCLGWVPACARMPFILACIAAIARAGLDGGKPRRCTIYNLQLSSMPQIWKGGGIIRARLLQTDPECLETNSEAGQLDGGSLDSPPDSTAMPGLRKVVALPPCRIRAC